jgi:hypothetical protein
MVSGQHTRKSPLDGLNETDFHIFCGLLFCEPANLEEGRMNGIAEWSHYIY